MAAAGMGTKEEDATGRFKTEEEAIVAIELCLTAGADINAANAQSQTALHAAAQLGFDKVVKFLAAKGANVNTKDQPRLHPARQRPRQRGRQRRLRQPQGCSRIHRRDIDQARRGEGNWAQPARSPRASVALTRSHHADCTGSYCPSLLLLSGSSHSPTRRSWPTGKVEIGARYRETRLRAEDGWLTWLAYSGSKKA